MSRPAQLIVSNERITGEVGASVLCHITAIPLHGMLVFMRLACTLLVMLVTGAPAVCTILQDEGSEQQADRAARRQLASRVTPLPPVNAAEQLRDAKPLADIIGDARIIGMGMAAPGGRELFSTGFDLLRYAVHEHGINVLALTASFPHCEALNAYIHGGDGDVEHLLHEQGYWLWDNRTMLDVLQWIRRYNADAPPSRALRICGLDMNDAGMAIDHAMQYLARFDALAARDLADRLAVLRGLEIFRSYPQWSDEQRDALTLDVGALARALDAKREQMVAATSEAAWQLARQYAAIVQQNEAWVRVHFVRAQDEPSVPSARSMAMASNARWVLKREGPDARMLIWGHNMDIARSPANAQADPDETTLGRDLAATFGDAYRAIAMTFGGGEVHAIHIPDVFPDNWVQQLRSHDVFDPRPGQVERLLGSFGHERLLLSLRAWVGAAGDDRGAAWLERPHPMWNLGSGYSQTQAAQGAYAADVVLTDCFDGLVYIDKLTPTHPNRRTRERFDMEELGGEADRQGTSESVPSRTPSVEQER